MVYVLTLTRSYYLQRESWQKIVSLLVSKAEVSSFCLELAKKMNMRYRSPPLPVNLSMVGQETNSASDDQSVRSKIHGHTATDSFDIGALAAMFNKKDV